MPMPMPVLFLSRRGTLLLPLLLLIEMNRQSLLLLLIKMSRPVLLLSLQPNDANCAKKRRNRIPTLLSETGAL